MRAVAVPYIIALILGVAVIGLVGYWFVSTGGKFGGQSAKTICDNKFLQWCITTGGSLASFIISNSECAGIVSYTACSEIVGSVGVGGGEPVRCGSQNQECCTPGNTCNLGLTCQNSVCRQQPQQLISEQCNNEGRCQNNNECCDKTCQFESC